MRIVFFYLLGCVLSFFTYKILFMVEPGFKKLLIDRINEVINNDYYSDIKEYYDRDNEHFIDVYISVSSLFSFIELVLVLFRYIFYKINK